MSIEDVKMVVKLGVAKDYKRVNFDIKQARQMVEDYEQLQAELDETKAELKSERELRCSIATVKNKFEKLVIKAKDENTKLNVSVVELEEKNRWIPVSERLPELNKAIHPHSERILLYQSGLDYPAVSIGYFDKALGWHDDDANTIAPTHWKPITLPEGEQT